MSDDMVPMPMSDVNDLDAVVHALGIEDSDTTPAEAVEELKAEIERLRARIARLEAAPEEKIDLDRLTGSVIDAYTLAPNDEDARREAVRAAINRELLS